MNYSAGTELREAAGIYSHNSQRRSSIRETPLAPQLNVRPLASESVLSMTDRSNGYERVAAEFLAGRGRAPATAIGARSVRDWACTLPPGATVIDVGCGSGLPITNILVEEGLNVYAIDASPSLVQAFRNNLPEITIACEAVEDSLFFERRFDGVVAWGLIFLLPAEEQRRLIHRVANILLVHHGKVDG